jgi:uncharacterized membrane protein (DUF2068 family)
MSRPVGVTASAIVAIIGSILMLLFAGMALASLFIQTSAPAPPPRPLQVAFGAAMFAAFAGIGLWSAVGLFRLRPWARVAILTLAAIIGAGSLFMFALLMVVPVPPDISIDTVHAVRGFAAAAFGIPLAISVWWLVQFNSATTKAAFLSSTPTPVSTRPIGTTILAWLSFIGAAYCAVPVFSRTPIFLLGAIYSGWSAALIYLIFAAISLYIGKGLLDLREEARIFAIGWFTFCFLQIALVAVVPSWRQRLFAFSARRATDQGMPRPVDLSLGLNLALTATAIATSISIWILIHDRRAFSTR